MLSPRALKIGPALLFDRQNALRHHAIRNFSGNSLVQTTVSIPRSRSQERAHDFRHEWRLQNLAIESSCDDTSVAVLSISRSNDSLQLKTTVHFHEKVTAKSEDYTGIHPLIALHSHQNSLGPLVQKAIQYLEPSFVVQDGSPETEDGKLINSGLANHLRFAPDFVTVTRGPGMRSNLSVGLDTAKGLAAAWGVPLVGVHHMQAHALTPRLCSTLKSASVPGQILHRSNFLEKDDSLPWRLEDLEPKFPFLSLLVSGGHTMLIDSKSLNDHKILAETGDIALGDFLDKAARAILLASELRAPYGKALEDFAFSPGDILSSGYGYVPPARRQDELERRATRWGWALRPPMSESSGGEKTSRRMAYTFSGLLTTVERIMSRRVSENRALFPPEDVSLKERREMAREVQRVAFEHLGSRILLHLSSLPLLSRNEIDTVVMSGGVASNGFLRHVLRGMLDARGFERIKLSFPPAALCTDNALMIAWAGMEMFDTGFESEMSIRPMRKWSMDPQAEDGGILGVDGWKWKPRKKDGVETDGLMRTA